MLPVRESKPTDKGVVLVPLPFQIVQTDEFAASVPASWKKDSQTPLFFIGDFVPFEVDAGFSFQAFAFEKKKTPPLAEFVKAWCDDTWSRKSNKPFVHAQAIEACIVTEARAEQRRRVAILRGKRVVVLAKLDYDGTLKRTIAAQFQHVIDSIVFR